MSAAIIERPGAVAVIVSEPQADRRKTAWAMWASLTIDPVHADALEAVREAIAGRLCDCALEASGSAAEPVAIEGRVP